MTKVSDVIEKGEAIPDDVTEVDDDNGYVWSHRPTGWWGPRAQSLPGEMLVSKFGPLTVTAVREPKPERTLIGPPHAHLDAPCTDKCYETASAEPEPSAADVSPLLDLVRQYGGEIGASVAAAECAGPDDVHRHEQAAQAILERIAALVPQQPLISVPLRERDELRAKLAESEISVAAMRATIDTLYALLGVEGAGVEVAVGAIEALKATAARPDPSVLSLPQVPPGTVALQGGAIWVRSADFPEMWVLADGGSTLHHLGALLDREEGSVSVVMREPRTWPRLDGAPEDVLKVEVHGKGIWKRMLRTPDAWCQGSMIRSLAQLRELGEVTEVFEDEPGGEPR